jgi:hypothetical protein
MSFKEYIGKAPTTVALNFKVGATLSPRLLLGGDITAIRSEATESGSDVALQISTLNAMLTYFPTGKGFFLRGGVGIANFTYEVSTPILSATNDTTGVSLLGGLGYAAWLGKSFNLTVNLDFAAQSYGSKTDEFGALPSSSSLWTLWAGFDWY